METTFLYDNYWIFSTRNINKTLMDEMQWIASFAISAHDFQMNQANWKIMGNFVFLFTEKKNSREKKQMLN